MPSLGLNKSVSQVAFCSCPTSRKGHIRTFYNSAGLRKKKWEGSLDFAGLLSRLPEAEFPAASSVGAPPLGEGEASGMEERGSQQLTRAERVLQRYKILKISFQSVEFKATSLFC